MIDKQNDYPEWVNDYDRGTRTEMAFKPESPSRRGESGLKKIWNDIYPSLAERKVAEAPKSLPADVAKWAVLPDWVELLDRHPHTQRNVFDWLDSWVPKSGHVFRSGAATLRRLEGHKMAIERQYGQGFNDPTPAFTFHGERMPFTETLKMLQRWVRSSRASYPDAATYDIDQASLDDWYKVMGGRSSTYVFAESSILFHGMTPQQETDSPIPWDVFSDSWNKILKEQFAGYGPTEASLVPSNAFVGTRSSSGVYLGNADGAAGYPYTNMDQNNIRDAFERPKFKGRVTKGVAFQHAFRAVAEWIKADMPMGGALYEAVAQPATLGYRGDRPVTLDIRALASRGQSPAHHDSAARLAAMLPSRSIIIVPTALILAESIFAQPLGDHIAGSATSGFDWVDPGHSVRRLDDIRQRDLQAEGSAEIVATVGADASGWDRDVVGQFHAGEAAWYMSMFPEEVSLLYGDAMLPLDVSSQWVASQIASLSAGGKETSRVPAILPDGSITTTEVTSEVITFNMWEFISKVVTMINDAPIRWANYEVDAVGIPYDLGKINPAFEGYSIVSNGGRRSGDAATGIGNTWTNLVVTDSAATMSQAPEFTEMRTRRAKLQETPLGKPYKVLDALARGDDLALAIALPKGGVPSEAVAGGITSVGMRANAKKQEASDIPGKPVFGFANVLVTEHYMGKLVGRTAQRYMVQESRGLNLEMLNAVRDSGNDTELSDTLIATTGTAKSRLAPLAGFPLMDEHPLTPKIIEWAVHNDKYRLAYLSDASFDDTGKITTEARTLLDAAARVEARAQARLRARRENVSVDLAMLQEVYLGSTVHDHIIDYALVDNYQPVRKMDEVNNHTLFKESVRTDTVLKL